MPIKAVLFDFGNTLISIELDWEIVLPQNITSLVRYLNSQNILVDIDPFGKRFVELKNQKHSLGQNELHEYKSVDVLRETLAEYSINHVTDTLLENAVDAYFTPERLLYTEIPGAHQVLQELKNQGYKLAIVSNASSGYLIRKTMQQHDFTKYFDVTIVSADIGYRKPHPKIFELALEQLNSTPQDSVMIGDVPAYDVEGPQKLGIKTILVKYQASSEGTKHLTDLQPDALANQITDIPQIIQSWN